jgi:hypothetical protein
MIANIHGSNRQRFLLTAVAAALCTTAALATETVTYSYDARGRLVKATRTGSVNDGVETDYDYDKADNRLLRTVSGAPSAFVPAASYELPEVGSGFIQNPTVSGASFAGRAFVAGDGSAWSFASAPDGDQVGVVQTYSGATGSISHNVTGLSPGATYRVVFMHAARPAYGGIPLALSVDGAGLGTFAPGSTSFASATSTTFVAGSSSATIAFAGSLAFSDGATAVDSVAVVRQPDVADFSFEAPEVGSGFTQNPTVTGATFAGRAFVAGNGSAWSFAAAPGGDQIGVIQTDNGATGAISQTVSGLIPGNSYRVRFMLAARPTFGGGIPLTLSVDGTSLGTFTPSSTSFASFASTTFTATAGTASLSFAGSLANSDGATAIDLVAVGPP